MKLYRLEKKVYRYWLDAYSSGFVTETRYFINYDKAVEWGKKDLDLWANYNNEMVPIDAAYKRGTYHIEEIVTAD